MKRTLSLLLVLALCLAFVSAPAHAAAANPFDKQDNKEVAYSGGLYFGLSASETESATIKPKITVEKKTLDAPTNDEIAITFSVNAGRSVDEYWGVASLYVGYDTRLTLKTKSTGKPYVHIGSATQELVYDTRTPSSGVAFIAFSGSSDYGCDGDMFSLVFTLPDDAKAGDLYPIGIFMVPAAAAICSRMSTMTAWAWPCPPMCSTRASPTAISRLRTATEGQGQMLRSLTPRRRRTEPCPQEKP